MHEFIPAAVGTTVVGAGIGMLTALIFGGSIPIGGLIGAGVAVAFILGFYIAVLLVIAGFTELLSGGK